MNKSIGLIFFAFVLLTVLLSGCAAAATESPAPVVVQATSTPLPTSTSLPTSTLTLTPPPASTPDPKVLSLEASGDLLKLIDTWDGKYVIFVGKNTGITTLGDLNGIPALCDSVFNSKNAASDMGAFKAAAGVVPLVAYGNDIPKFLQIMAGNQNIIAFISKANADKNSLQSNPNLKIIVFK